MHNLIEGGNIRRLSARHINAAINIAEKGIRGDIVITKKEINII
jgi:hypothetical protein